jgi:hypothetical protein
VVVVQREVKADKPTYCILKAGRTTYQYWWIPIITYRPNIASYPSWQQWLSVHLKTEVRLRIRFYEYSADRKRFVQTKSFNGVHTSCCVKLPRRLCIFQEENAMEYYHTKFHFTCFSYWSRKALSVLREATQPNKPHQITQKIVTLFPNSIVKSITESWTPYQCV